jgi:VIT1/CCC1 family predicted Fe2+/Mn2+ transporter
MGFANLFADGFSMAVDLVTADRKRWVQTMLTEEYGLPYAVRSPWVAALSTFSSFLVCGIVPLIPFVFKLPNAFTLSLAMTGAVFFVIGSVKSKWSTASWLRSGLLTLCVGAIAAGLAYAAGVILRIIAE